MARRLQSRYSSAPVNRNRHFNPTLAPAPALRLSIERWISVSLVVLMLVVGMFSRATFLSHEHDGHGMHMHHVSAHDDGKLTAVDHADDHGHDHGPPPSNVPTDQPQSGLQLAEVPGGILISIDAHMQMLPRGIDLGKTLSRAICVALIAFVLPTAPHLDEHVGSPGGGLYGEPMNLLALSASDRLVRTSRALLI